MAVAQMMLSRAVPSFQGPRPGSVQHPRSAIDLPDGRWRTCCPIRCRVTS
jgi:hypothetical protein